jgi:hypothetical protein
MRRRISWSLLIVGALLLLAGLLPSRPGHSLPRSLPRESSPPGSANTRAIDPATNRAPTTDRLPGVPSLPSDPGAPLPPPYPQPSPLPPPALRAPEPLTRALPSASGRQRGVALGLFAEDISFDYGPLIAEIVALGASHIALVVPLYQEHGASTRLALHTRLSPTLAATGEAIRAARRLGLEVTLFPIVRLSRPRTPNEWRGTLAPANLDAWFDSYTNLLGDFAALGAMTGASRLVIGSELSSLDNDLPRWRRLIERMRGVFPGTLLYSANWDHYKDAQVLDLVDEAGVVAYFDLRSASGPGDVSALERRWRTLRAELTRWRRGKTQPFVFTEVGYRSRVGSTATPWDEGSGGAPDLEEQRRGFEAFRRAWTTKDVQNPQDAAAMAQLELAGLYVWNWYGYGGPGTSGYTPRGKPAAAEIQQLFQSM